MNTDKVLKLSDSDLLSWAAQNADAITKMTMEEVQDRAKAPLFIGDYKKECASKLREALKEGKSLSLCLVEGEGFLDDEDSPDSLLPTHYEFTLL